MDFTVIVACRNEELRIGGLLKSLLSQQTTCEWEIVFVDDYSTDTTVDVIEKFMSQFDNSQLIKLHDEYGSKYEHLPNKKRALSLAINNAKGKWILTTDADCTMNEQWIDTFYLASKSEKADCFCGPVAYQSYTNFISLFATFDLIAMMAMTKLSISLKVPILSNGANMAFKKNVFDVVNPYQDNLNIYSGDDVFLLQRLVNEKFAVSYLENEGAIVETAPPLHFKEFLNQRIRWAGKTIAYRSWQVKAVIALIYISNLIVFLSFIHSLYSLNWNLFLILFGSKLILDFGIVLPQLMFFKKLRLLVYLVLIDFLHIFYVVFVGLLSLNNGYEWRGRKVIKK